MEAFGFMKRDREQSMRDLKDDDMDLPGYGKVKDVTREPFLYRNDGLTIVRLQCDGDDGGCRNIYEIAVLDEHKRPSPTEMEQLILQHAREHQRDEHGVGSPYLCPHGCAAAIHLYRKPQPKTHDTETI